MADGETELPDEADGDDEEGDVEDHTEGTEDDRVGLHADHARVLLHAGAGDEVEETPVAEFGGAHEDCGEHLAGPVDGVGDLDDCDGDAGLAFGVAGEGAQEEEDADARDEEAGEADDVGGVLRAEPVFDFGRRAVVDVFAQTGVIYSPDEGDTVGNVGDLFGGENVSRWIGWMYISIMIYHSEEETYEGGDDEPVVDFKVTHDIDTRDESWDDDDDGEDDVQD